MVSFKTSRKHAFLAALGFLLSFSVHAANQRGCSLDAFDAELFGTDFSEDSIQPKKRSITKSEHKKDWTFICYMAADNDLRSFAARNIKQMAAIGSNQYINIVVHLDIRITGGQKITRRYLVEKNKIIHVNIDDAATQKMDSGNPETLISCCDWAISQYPANNYALVFWNHGTGIIDPNSGRVIDSSELFTFNPLANRLELDRRISAEYNNEHQTSLDIRNNSFLNYTTNPEQMRGVCWDDTTGNFLSNQKLEQALNTICTNMLDGKKLSLICFDACLMSMVEVANIVKKYAHIMVGSQEVELGSGWNYQKALEPFLDGTMTKEHFGAHITYAYGQTYAKITNDYTQSSINLDVVDFLERNINTVATLLLEAMDLQKNRSVKTAIKTSRNKLLCTHFDEPSYIDLHHFYTNMLLNLPTISFIDEHRGRALYHELGDALVQGCKIIDQIVMANVVGKNLSKAHGISIYFPERNRLHSSYQKTNFAAKNHWADFLTHYLMA